MEKIRSASKQKSKRKNKKSELKTKPKGPSNAYIMFTAEQLNKIRKDPEFVNADGTNKKNPRTGEPYMHTAFMSIAG
jgi:hypothetical protein